MSKTTSPPPMRKEADSGKRSHSYKYSYGYSGYARETRPRKLNAKLFFVSLAVVLVAAPATYFWHDYQTQKLSESLWEYGEKQAAEENWQEASAAFYRVWSIRQDPKLLGDAVAAYDKLVADSNRSELIAAYQKAIGGLPKRLDLRERLAELLARERQFKSAFIQTEKVLGLDPENQIAKKWRAIALLGMLRNKEPAIDIDVLEELKLAYVGQQNDFEIASALVSHIRDDLQAQNGSELATQADGVINRLVAANPESVQSYLTRYKYRRKHKLPGAKRDIEQAVLLNPENPTVVRQAAWDALRDASSGWKESDYLTARQLFKELIALTPKHENGYVGLGDTEFLVAGNMQRAIDIWNRGCREVGDSLPLLLRIAEGQTNLFQFDKLDTTLASIDKLMLSLPAMGAERDRNWAKSSVALFRGKMLLAKQLPLEAIGHLQLAADLGGAVNSTGSMRSSGKSTSFAALMSLGTTYRDLGRQRDAAATFERALKLNAESESALLASAEAWAELGNLSRAIRNIEKALRLPKPSSQLYRVHAQYLLERELSVSSRDRDWRDFEEALAVARSQLADSWQLRLLEVDYAIHRIRPNQTDNSAALGKLLALEQDFAKTKEVWQILPFAYESLGLSADADRALNRLELLTSSSAETKFLTVDLLLWRNEPEKARNVLESVHEDSLSPQERISRDIANLGIVEFEGDDQQIDQALIACRSKYETDPLAVERLLDRRVCKVSTTKVPSDLELIQDLQRRQPESQASWQYYAGRLELEKEKPDLVKVQKWLNSLTKRLPHWSRTEELAGRLARFEGMERDARLAFRGAVSKPNPNPELVRHMMGEASADGDYLSNVRLIERHRQLLPLSRMLNNGRWAALRRKLDFGFVDRGLADGSTPAMWQALLGSYESDTSSDDVVSSLMLTIWRDGDDSSTSKLLNELESIEFASADQRAFVVGQGYHLAGKLAEAKQEYRKVVEDSSLRLQAEIYAGNASAQMFRQRSREVDEAEAKKRSKVRLEAIVKLRRAGRNDLKTAGTLLNKLVNLPGAVAIDGILYASCLERLGEAKGAVRQLESVVEREPTAYHLSVLIDFLLRSGEYDKAEIWIDQLEEQTGWQKTTVLLRARWMVATNRLSEINPFVEMYATERFKRAPRDPATEMRDVSEIYRQVGLVDDAERWLETLASRFPNEAGRLSQLLVDNDEMDRAIQRCVDQLNDEPTVETATLLARILVYGEANPTTLGRVMPLLEECHERFPSDPSFLFALGNVYIRSGEKATAIDLLSRVTEFQPGHYLAWNNLAAMLAEEDGREDEAMVTINQALSEAAYEIPTLLDTKAVVLMHQDRFQAAASLLQNEVTSSRAASDPRFYFHLAMSQEQLGETELAKEALEESIGLDLDRSFLTEFEQAELERLLETLDVDAQ